MENNEKKQENFGFGKTTDGTKPVNNTYQPPKPSPVLPAHTSTSSLDAKEGFSVNNTLGIIIIILLLIGITMTLAGRYDKEDTASDTDNASTTSLLDSIFDSGDDDDVATATDDTTSNSATKPVSNTASVSIPTSNYISSVSLAFLADSSKVGGKKAGCDYVYFVSLPVTPTTAPLNAAMRTLFNKNVTSTENPGNFIGTQSSLKFSEARLDNGVASIYLTGEIGPFEDEDCDEGRLFTQINETALQFSTVKSVRVYLDGKLLELGA